MNDKKRPLSGLLSELADVVSDLYGENAAALERLTRQVQDAPELDPTLMQAGAAPTPAAPRRSLADLAGMADQMARPATAKKPALPPFEDLWKTADEAIDWTEALASPTPTDGLTDPAKWTLYHQQAANVLHGDVSAYLKVLNAANPMADLMPFVGSLDVRAQSSDDMRAVFTARPDLMENGAKRYLSGMAVRIARDLFAVLPVTRVTVTARSEAQELLTVEFSRQEIARVRFAFIDPEAFVAQCGGVFTGESAQ